MEEKKEIKKASGESSKNSTKSLDLIITSVLFLIFAVVPIFFTGLASQGIGFEKMILFYFLVLIGVVAWVTKGVILGDLSLKRTPLDLPILVFLVIATVSTLLSVDARDSFVGAYGQAAKGLSAYFIFALFYYLLVNNINKKRIKIFFTALLVSTSLVSVYSLLQLFAKYILPIQFTHSVSFNPFGTLTALTMFLVVMLPMFVIAVSKYEDIFSVVNKNLVVFFKVLLGLVSLAMVTILFLLNGFTFWPAALVGITVLLMFFLSKIIKVSNNNVVFPVAIFLLLIIFMVMGNVQVGSENLPVEVSLSRSASWNVAKSSLKADPIFGSGPSTFYYDFAMHKSPAFNNTQLWNVRFENATGLFFELLATMGVLGALSFMVILLTILSIVFISLTKVKKDSMNPILLALFASYITLLIIATLLSLNSAVILTFAIISAFVVSVAVYTYPEEFKSLKLSFRSSPKYALGLAAIFLTVSAGVVVLFTVGLKMYMADIYATKAVQAKTQEQRIQYLNKAIAMNASEDEYHLSLANAYMGLANRGVISNASPDEIRLNLSNAIDASKKAAELSPNKARNNESVALIYENASFYTKGALELADNYYNEVARLDPHNPTPYLRLALVNVARANSENDQAEKNYYYEEALKQYDKAIAQKGDLASAHYGKAVVYEKMNQIDNSIANLSSANLFSPNNIDYRFELGRLYFNKGIATLGLKQTQSAQIIQSEANNEGEDGATENLVVQPNVNTSKVEKNDDLARAEQIFLSIVAANKKHANALYSLAILYQKIDNTELASQRVKELLSILSEGQTKEAVKNQFRGLY
ncbi:hypothetical protein C0584_00060 [Candidatus Parcubacteria bacterium]|nr:MAG: hypothetical protein C0584_00060 [Candidatus Parcubacteria bacterium]